MPKISFMSFREFDKQWSAREERAKERILNLISQIRKDEDLTKLLQFLKRLLAPWRE